MTKPVLDHLDFNHVSKIINLPDGVNPQDAVTVAQLNAAVEGLAWKDSCRVATQANLNLSSPGATIDGITMATNDRVLVMSQTTPSQNGIYIWNGAATSMARALDANTSSELEAATLTVEEGSSAGACYRQTSVNFVLDTGAVLWVAFGTSVPDATTSLKGKVQLATQAEVDAGTDAAKVVTPATLANTTLRIKKYTTTIGDDTETSYTVTHNLNSRDVAVDVYRTAAPYDSVLCTVQKTTVNTLTIVFAVAPTVGQYTVVVIG